MSWNNVSLGRVAGVQSGYAFKSTDFTTFGIRLLRNTNILPGHVYWDDLECLDSASAPAYSEYRLNADDIILSLDRPVISSGIKVARISKADLPALLVQRVARFRVDSTCLDPDYLYAFLRSPQFISAISGHNQSLGVPHISPTQVEAVQILLPSLPEQSEIARRLSLQLETVEEARQAATTQLRELTHLANAIIRETLAHPDTQAHSLGDVLHEVKQGVGARWADFPVLGATRDGLAPAKEPVGKHPERYKPVQVGTVFYNPMRILIGSIAMVDQGDAPGITSPDYVALRGREGVVDSRWFYYWLRSPEGERCISSLARGAVRERMLFNRLAEGEIALPPYPLQQAASRVLAELRPMKQSIEARLREIERLPQRLLAEVFDMEEDVQDA